MSFSKTYNLFFVFVIMLLLYINSVFAQNIGINSTGATPDNSAMLDISATNKGLLIPRVFLNSTSDAVTIPNPATALLVWNINPSIGGGTGFYYNAGSVATPVWIKLVTAGELSNDWSLTGNSGTIDGTHFIGTTDNRPINFRVNNQKSGRIDSIGGNTSIGYRSLDVNTGTGNSAFGMYSLLNNTTGSNNSANGYTALRHNTRGTNNTATGDGALYSNNTGNNNTATGKYSLFSNGSGDNNTALGYNAGVIFSNLTNATAIGYNAQVRTSNSLVLGDTTNVNVGIGTGAPTAKLDIVGQIRIRGGVPGIGKVLTSDAAGTATWETLVATGGTLEQAYNFGGAGAGRVISANTGAVEINKTTQRQANLIISGQEYDSPGNSSHGIAIMAGVNRATNKQLWITDQQNVATPNAINPVIRIMLPDQALGAIDAIATNGSTLLPLILQGGGNNVGIGTYSPTQRLDVDGQIRIRGGVPGIGKVLTSDATGTATWETLVATGGTLEQAYNSGGAGAGRIISANTGAVEISKTTQRQANLIISGQEYYQSGNTASGIAILAGVNRPGNKQLWITNQDFVAAPNATNAVARIIPGNGFGAMDVVATNGTTLLPLILQGGGNNVGIGTVSPTQRLDIEGQIRIRGGVPGIGKVLTSDASGTATWETPIGGGTLNEAYNFGGTGAGRIISANTGAVEISKTIQRQANLIISGQEYYEAGNAANGIAIMAGINRPGSKQLWITSQDFIATPNATNGVVRIIPESGSGTIDALATNGTTSLPLILQGAGSNVGIGTTAPTQRLDIDGQIRIRGGVPGTGKVLVSSADGTASWQAPTSLGDWTLSGNTGTVDGTHFIGTTDSRPLNFRVNNQKAGRIDTLGRNTSFGYRSLDANTGTANSAFGMNALRGNIAGNNNTAIGAEALYSNRAGYRAVAIGSRAMYYANSTMASFDSRNTAIGYEALRGSSSAASNTGYNNTVIGYQSMLFNSTGYSNVAVGERTLNENETGYSNTAIGQGALFYNRRGNENTAIGRDALLGNSSGSQNTAVGMNALQASRAGSGATAIGDSAMYHANNTTTAFINQNVAIGKEALRGSNNPSNNTGNSNTVVGFRSLQNNSSGGMNVTLGTNTLVSNTLGGQNTAIGYQALLGNTIGSNNVALGSSAGDALVTGSNNVVIGYNAQASAINVSNEVTVGNSNHNVYRMFSASWTNASDRRLKHNIQPLKPGLDFVMQLQPVEYVYNNSDSERKTIGFVAQDVQSNLHAHQMDGYNLVSQLDEKYLGLNTTELIGVLTKAIQEQQQIINTLDDELNTQKNRNSELEERLIKLELMMNK